MGEICHEFKDYNPSSGSWSRNTSNHHCRNYQKTNYDIDSPSYTSFYKVSTWKHMFWKSKNNSCPNFEDQNLNIQENALDYMVMKLKSPLSKCLGERRLLEN